MKIQVPGNLLLFGEYAVTIPGGKGLAVAIDSSVFISSEKAETLSLTCEFQGTKTKWKPGGHFPLIDTILNAFPNFNVPLKIHIDSSALYDSEGRKKGYGSSAAVTAGLTYLLLTYTLKRAPDLKQEVFPKALTIHRKFQNGKGSGYDVATSLFGGAGLFIGGELPTWNPLSIPWIEHLFLVRGREEVSTKKILPLFETLDHESFVEESNLIVEQAIKEKNHQSLKATLEKARELNLSINQKMGITLDDGFPGKPLGSGGEIHAMLEPTAESEPLKYAPRGLTCKP